MAGITPYTVQQTFVSIADAEGNYQVGAWVQADDTGPEPVYLVGDYNIAELGASLPLAVLLTERGYDTSDLS